MLTDAKIAALKPPVAGQAEHPDHKVTGLRLRIGSSGKKTWIVRRRVGPKVLNKKVGTYPPMGLAAARKAAERILEALASDGTTDALDRTFGAVAETWIEKVAKPKNDSWKLQERRLEMHVLPTWGERKIQSIKRSDVRELIEGIEGDVLPNRVLSQVKTIFRFALSRDWIEASPIEGIEKPKSETPRDRVLDMNESKAVWEAAEHMGYPFGPYVRVLQLTAQRRTEVAAMRWDAVDLDAGTWTLTAEDTKGDRATLVPLSRPVVEILKAVPRIGPFVFTSDGETHISGFAKGKARLDKFLKASGAVLKPWTLHDLRRTAATHMVRLGVSEEVVGRILNHAVKGVTAKVYALHSYAPEKRSALDRWAADLARAIDGASGSTVVSIRG
ncbi:tyrosine-type recombinase/integrase [Sphingomonas rhizophila]|uniref:Tyrosine-type recombinase/integrase n=1 Tax=Sphingomonas rhizophila TaxID=2071607 RepID=A0A7G9S924_9SPHN|nr:site-specific integrase [Sphingomonas rhizophila]QNN64349.1 tyrosine-type recombinase/integrase [Sphingomonas rhizophila]